MNDLFELIEPKASLWIGTLLQVIIISIEGDWVEWYFDDGSDVPNIIKRSQIREEDGKRYFMYSTKGHGGRMFYLNEFCYH